MYASKRNSKKSRKSLLMSVNYNSRPFIKKAKNIGFETEKLIYVNQE